MTASSQKTLFLFITAGLLFAPASGEELATPSVGAQARSASKEEVAVVVNLANNVENLSKDELRRIFLGERSHWPNGRRITVVMMEPGQPEREAILHDVCHMSETNYNNHMLHGLFTGEVFASPKTLAAPVGVRKFVFNVPGAIGYLRSINLDHNVKVIKIDGHLPGDRQYTIKLESQSK